MFPVRLAGFAGRVGLKFFVSGFKAECPFKFVGAQRHRLAASCDVGREVLWLCPLTRRGGVRAQGVVDRCRSVVFLLRIVSRRPPLSPTPPNFDAVASETKCSIIT